MSSVAYSLFLPEVMQYVPDVPELVAENAIRSACIEFCERTRFWQDDSDPITLSAGTASYEVDLSASVKFVDIIEAWVNDRLVIPKSVEDLTRIFRGCDWRSLEGTPSYITRMISTELIIVPKPAKAGEILRIRAAYAPTRTSTSISRTIFEEYLEAIAYGARARLYNTPKQPYFDKASALEFDKRFRTAISEARVRVNRGLTRASGQIEFQRIA
jgi:hypothetical protein